MLTQEQLNARSHGLGGSDAAAIAGVGYKSAFDVWHEKVTNQRDEISNELMYWGNQIEPLLVKRYEEETGLTIETPTQTFYHPKHKFILGHIDGYNKSENILLECKVTRNSHEWGNEGTDDIPKHYLCQVAHYASILNPTRVDLAVFFADQLKFARYVYFPNKRLQDTLLNLEVNFWLNHVVKRQPPNPKSLEDAKKVWPVVEDKKCMATTDIILKVDDLRALKIQAKSISEQEDQIKRDLIEFMQNAETLTDSFDNVVANRKLVTSNRFDLTAFKSENPELYKQYLKESQSERFMVK